MSYAELHCISNFTFLRGASHPAELVERAKSLGYAALALTDECSLAGVVRAHAAAQEREIADAMQLCVRHRASRPREVTPAARALCGLDSARSRRNLMRSLAGPVRTHRAAGAATTGRPARGGGVSRANS